MSFLRSVVVKLIALLLIVAGFAGMREYRFLRTYVQTSSYTFASATPQELDAMFAEASKTMATNYRGSYHTMTREQSNNAMTLSVAIHADSWSDLSDVEDAFSSGLRMAAASRQLTINGTGSSGGSRMSDKVRSNRWKFISFAALSAFGIAMLVLSFRVFGGGRREAVPELGSPESAPTVTTGN
jgi:hypothetical protein